jgi:hypothetical protein
MAATERPAAGAGGPASKFRGQTVLEAANRLDLYQSASNGRSGQSPFSEIGVPGDASTLAEQGNKQSGLLVREAAQYLTITPE